MHVATFNDKKGPINLKEQGRREERKGKRMQLYYNLKNKRKKKAIITKNNFKRMLERAEYGGLCLQSWQKQVDLCEFKDSLI